MQPLTKRIRILLTLFLFASLFFYVDLYAQSAPIKIGILLDLSGQYKDLGSVSYEAFQKYLRVINDSGGIRGRRLELIFADTGGTNSGLLIGASRLKDQGVVALIGPTSIDNVILLRRFAETHKIPLMLINGSSPILTYRTIKTKWTFSSTLTFDAEIKSLFSVFKKRGYESLSVLVQANDFYRDLSLWIRGYAPEYNLKLGCFEAFYLNKEDLEFKLKYIAKCIPDVCLIWANENAYEIINQTGPIQIPVALSHDLLKKGFFYNSNNWSLSFVSLPRLLTKNFIWLNSLSAQHIFFFSIWPKEDFYNLTIKQQLMAAVSWDGMGLLTAALRQVARVDRAFLRDSLEENIKEFPGLIGKITFDKRDHSGLDPNSLSVLLNFKGKWKIIK